MSTTETIEVPDIENVIEVNGEVLVIKILSQSGFWAPIFKLDTNDPAIYNLYRLPLLLKVGCFGQSSHLNELPPGNTVSTPQCEDESHSISP